MCMQRSNLFERFLMLFALLVMITSSLVAQTYSTADRINFKKGRYHKKTGWINSLGFYTGNWDELRFEYPEHYTMQYEYLGYKLVKPRLGLGGGVALKFSPTHGLGMGHGYYYKFAEVFAYTKGYLNNKRRRLYVDTRIGYAHAFGDVAYWCHCDEGRLNLRYSSGPTIQAGIGIDIAGSKAIRKGIKLSYYQNFINIQRDLYPEDWKTTADGIIKRKTSAHVLKRLVVGISLYI